MLTGIADAHHVDLKLLRFIVIVATVFFPPTIVLYILAWVLLPEAPRPGISPADLFAGGSRNWLALVVALVAFLAFVEGPLGWGAGRRGNLIGAVLLVGLGAWLWSQHGRDARRQVTAQPWSGATTTASPADWSTAGSGATGAGRGAPTAGAAWPGTMGYAGTVPGAGGAAGGATEVPWEELYPWTSTLPTPPAPPPAAPPPPVTRATVAATLLSLGLAFAGDRLGWYRLDVTAVFALVLGVLGVGIAIGALIGGGRLLILPALILVPLTIGTARIGPIHLTGGIGDRLERPLNSADAARGYHHGIGQLTVDLRDVGWTGNSLRVPVQLGIGQARVWVPGDVLVRVNAHVGAGVVDVLNHRADGTGVDETYEVGPSGATRTLVLDVEDGIGHVEVQTDPSLPGG